MTNSLLIWTAYIFMLSFIAVSSKGGNPRTGEHYKKLSDDGAWCWFQDPRAVTVEGKHRRTYAQWMTSEGKLQVGYFDHDTGEIQVVTLKENWDIDDHNVGSFLVLPDKRLMVFYALHDKTGLFCRTASYPENINQWENEVIIDDSHHITYSHPVYLTEENRYYVFYRGPSWKPTFSTSSDGKIWSQPQILIEETGRESHDIRPYIKIVSDGKSTICFGFTDGHPRDENENSIYYLKYHKGRFYRVDGTMIGTIDHLPIEHKHTTLVYDGRETKVRAWVWDIALDKQGHPVIAYTRLPKETDHRYHYVRWTGKEWLDIEICPGGKWFPQTPREEKEPEPHYSGGMALDHSNPSILYLSRPIKGIFEIEKWSTSDKGNHWISDAITENSKTANVRPVVPRGNIGKKDHLLWMHGNYIHYTNYHTDIRIEPGK